MALAKEVEAIKVGQMQIRDHSVEMTVMEFSQGLQPICDHRHAKLPCGQILREETANQLFIISD